MTFAAIATATTQLLKYRVELFALPLAREVLLAGLASGFGLLAIWIFNQRRLHACLVLIFVSLWGLTTLLVLPLMDQSQWSGNVTELLGEFVVPLWPRSGEPNSLVTAMIASGVVSSFSPAVFSIPFRLRGWGLR